MELLPIIYSSIVIIGSLLILIIFISYISSKIKSKKQVVNKQKPSQLKIQKDNDKSEFADKTDSSKNKEVISSFELKRVKPKSKQKKKNESAASQRFSVLKNFEPEKPDKIKDPKQIDNGDSNQRDAEKNILKNYSTNTDEKYYSIKIKKSDESKEK